MRCKPCFWLLPFCASLFRRFDRFGALLVVTSHCIFLHRWLACEQSACARNPQGESGKLNCDKDKVWNIWCHQNGSSQVGDMLVVPGGAIVRWLPIKRGDEIPLAAVFVGYTPNDGPVYVARAKGECGKLNCDNGLAWNIWCHQSGVTTEGEILTVEASSSTPEPRQWFGAGKKGEWRPFSPDIVKILNEASWQS